MNRPIHLILLGFFCWAGLAEAATGVSRGQLVQLERWFDKRIQTHSLDDPMDLLGTTRAVYLEGYGVVFTAEVNLVASAVVTPFRPAFTPEEVARLRQKKLARLEDLKRLMLEMMVEAARRLNSLSPDERIVVAVSLFRYSWEDARGLPAQLLLQAPRNVLLTQSGEPTDWAKLLAVVQMKEF